MKDDRTGIEVVVRQFESHTPYQEYKATRASPLYVPRKNVRFIEAVTNERFEIGVIVPNTFRFGYYPHLQIAYDIDGGVAQFYNYIDKADKQAGRPMTDCLDHAHRYIDGKWEEVGYTFGQTVFGKCSCRRRVDVHPNRERTDSDNELSRDEENMERSKRGKVNVTLRLGRGTESERKLDWKTYEPLPQETSKTVAVDGGRSHSMQ